MVPLPGRDTMSDQHSIFRTTWERRIGRRRFLAGSAAGAVGLFLAACGGDDDSPATEATADATASPAETAAAYPRSVEHELGTVDLPAFPEHIVSVTENE